VQFADTNVLLYAISREPAESRKARRANELLAAGEIGLSVQVLQEFYVQATRASRPDAITHEQATGLVEAWRRFPVQDLTVEVMVGAFEILATTRAHRAHGAATAGSHDPARNRALPSPRRGDPGAE
jgi:predicted nucleic acid-binding protein